MQRFFILPVLTLSLAGCGDSLISGPALERLLGFEPFPSQPAWLPLWVDEGGEGVLYTCEFVPVPGSVDRQDADTVVIGKVWVPPPEWTEPVAWTEEDDFSWALGLHLLVDRERFDFEMASRAFDDEEVSSLAGVWGLADSYARLHGEGDLEAMGDAVVAGQVPPELDDDGRTWVGFAQEIVLATGTFAGAVTALDPEETSDLYGGIPVRSLSSLDDASIALLLGQPFGGVGLSGRCEDLLDAERTTPPARTAR